MFQVQKNLGYLPPKHFYASEQSGTILIWKQCRALPSLLSHSAFQLVAFFAMYLFAPLGQVIQLFPAAHAVLSAFLSCASASSSSCPPGIALSRRIGLCSHFSHASTLILSFCLFSCHSCDRLMLPL